MSTLKTNNVQVGQSLTASNNFTLYQPSTPDGTVRIGNGNVGSVTDIITLNNSGNVGIGTSSPNSKLVVGTPNPQSTPTLLCLGGATQSVAGGSGQLGIYGTDAAAADMGGTLSFTANTTSLNGYAMATISGKYQTAGAGVYGGYLQFCTTNSGGSVAERARIDSGGNLLVGTADAQANFYILKSANFPMQRLYNNAGTYSSELFQIITAQGSSSAFNFAAYYVSNAAAYAAKIRGDGNIYNANNVYAAISDAKLKENVEDATPKLDKLLGVKIRSYNLVGDDQKQLGVIAQELEDVFPGLVEETADRDVDGVDLGTTTKSVKYSVFIPMLIKAIQELSAKNDSLEARIIAAEEQIIALGTK
jgi:hypothetical protein